MLTTARVFVPAVLWSVPWIKVHADVDVVDSGPVLFRLQEMLLFQTDEIETDDKTAKLKETKVWGGR